jgi:hypothetical protein
VLFPVGKLVAAEGRLTYFAATSARVAQLDRASASGAEGCGFDPRLAYQVSLIGRTWATE